MGIDCPHLQVCPHSLVDIQRDYLSLEKRYPRLFVSPEFTKVHTSCYMRSRRFYQFIDDGRGLDVFNYSRLL